MSLVVSRKTERATRHQFYDEELLELYRKRAGNFHGRKIEFLKSNYKNATLEAGIIAGGGALAGGVAGGVVGAIAGGCCIGPPGIPLGGGIGFAVGFVVGGAIGTGIAAAFTYPKYKEWLVTEEGKTFGGELKAFLSKNILSYQCGITHEVPVDCVRTPQGQIYERETIVAWIRARHTDPMTRGPLEEKDLIDDNEATLNVTKDLARILEEDMSYLKKECPSLLPGLNALNKDMTQRNIQSQNMAMIQLQQQLARDEITPAQYRALCRQLNDKYFS